MLLNDSWTLTLIWYYLNNCVTFFNTKNDEWFLDSSIDIKQENPLMRFDKMETYAEYSLQLMSQGPSRGGDGFGHWVFYYYFDCLRALNHLFQLLLPFSMDFEFSLCHLHITLNQRILNVTVQSLYCEKFMKWKQRCIYLNLCQLNIQGCVKKKRRAKIHFQENVKNWCILCIVPCKVTSTW